MISGPEDAVLAVAEELREHGRRVHQLAVSHAFHSSLMEPMLLEFNTVAGGMSLAAPTIPVVSNVTGELAGPGLRHRAVLGRATSARRSASPTARGSSRRRASPASSSWVRPAA